MIMLSISPISAFSDNYIWCVARNGEAIIVDPGDATPVIKHIEKMGLTLSGILITHHHYDHVNGIDSLLELYPDIPVYGPDNQCSSINHRVRHNDSVTVLGLTFQVIAVPGHTLDHIAYYLENSPSGPALFCGDTLFAGGCGRLFEGTPEQMLNSLGLIQALPTNTAVYCAHEYTLSNLNFALVVEPENHKLQDRFVETQARREKNVPTVPSELALELLTNPFLRTGNSVVQQRVAAHADLKSWNQIDIFASLRAWKDGF
jgi:hydroxyacylglutathione hydrolase